MAHLNPIPKESFAGNMGISSAEWGVSMAMGRPKAALILRPEQREQLEGMASSRSLLGGLVSRAWIILLSASGKTNLQIARHMGLTNATVGKWRRRFLEQDVSGLHDELRPGRPRPISDERVAQLVRKTLDPKPKDGTHWSVRQIAEQTRVSKSTVHRIWQAGAAPAETFQALDRSIFCRES